jgi:hypothetical protein
MKNLFDVTQLRKSISLLLKEFLKRDLLISVTEAFDQKYIISIYFQKEFNIEILDF